MTTAYVGLGANLGDREATIRAAVEALSADEGIEVADLSTLRETEPVGVGEQPLFLNGVVALDTTLSARELLDRLLEALATAVADELGQRFAPERVRVQVRKPEVRPAGLDGTVAATVTRP